MSDIFDRARELVNGRVDEPGFFDDYDQACKWAGVVQELLDAKSPMIRTVEELQALPHYAVIEDRNNAIWQKQPYTVFGCGYAWFKPGSYVAHPTRYVELSARLLDDGL